MGNLGPAPMGDRSGSVSPRWVRMRRAQAVANGKMLLGATWFDPQASLKAEAEAHIEKFQRSIFCEGAFSMLDSRS